ncbi:MAG: hypothetical protein ACN4EF_04015 [Wenyingzhuangia sp.]|uniref:hypothetical protein n=1 Tax=Wenyingzhuangia sp. TaxID=1964193 RepID=UPI00321BE7AD
MQNAIKSFFCIVLLTSSLSLYAGPPEKESIKTSKEVTLDSKSLDGVFMKIKRVDNILSPNKKLRKKKYTIA